MEKYDVSEWKPCTYEAFVDHLGHLTYCQGDDFGPITFTTEHLRDNRIRLVASGLMHDGEGETKMLPYLMMLHDPEGGKNLCFVRTGVQLDDQR